MNEFVNQSVFETYTPLFAQRITGHSEDKNVIKTNYGSEKVIPLYITGCKKKTCFESAVVAKRRRLLV